ncbi:nitrate- and nitrite sensing domain-containing protein [Gilvimarinus sp. SDUM040013]|uniref:Nitrate- and nitrite sensing domain-containing protein n=1 Tax=Gilvimarinus gilvus TaxID=3058038 RepID=A0ABU4RVK7_9GAMM|nr:nitrate- and nitrite sensing domain-containing protein [Gilvimarinus sp. SDUM040013]MDO3387648.1 nitrate- and nitrite sensing domain-containing protein [Gilvimarinus sp. SDUM040013]MDX6848911.1 nitrate- and nitrite sensing domain-containing protein [Gilvimarinus sp. SDUM040013]
MNMIWIGLMLFVCTTTAAVVVLAMRRKKARIRQQMQGLHLLRNLRFLLSELQQHRGLSSGWLNGATELDSKIRKLQGDITRQKSDASRSSLWLAGNARWLSIIDHWQRLEAGFNDLELDQNIKQHNALIQSLLYLIDDMAQSHDLLLINVKGKPLNFAWRELLIAAECVGQLRAMGTAVAASGECSVVSRIRLNYLCQKIDSATTTAWQTMPPQHEHKQKLIDLNHYVAHTIIQREQAANAENYFALATEAIEGIYNQFDQAIDSARRLS